MTQPEHLAALLRAKTQSALSVVVVPSCHATLCRPLAFVLTSWALCQLPADRTFTSQLLLWAAPPPRPTHKGVPASTSARACVYERACTRREQAHIESEGERARARAREGAGAGQRNRDKKNKNSTVGVGPNTSITLLMTAPRTPCSRASPLHLHPPILIRGLGPLFSPLRFILSAS